MNKSELIDAIAADAGITKAAAKLALEILGNVSGTLKTGGRVSLVGFGSWSVSAKQRDGRNPQTGKTIQIAAKNVVKFSGCRIRRCSKLIVSFKPIIIKPSLWKVFLCL
jgi:DNA-binding protein HU-beta